MGTLRNKMIDAMNLRRFSLRTHESYLGAISSLARYYNLPPDKIDAQQLQAYLLHLTVERGLSWSTCNVAVSAFRFFYVEVLGRERTDVPMPPRKKPTKLPEILSRQELERCLPLLGLQEPNSVDDHLCRRSARQRNHQPQSLRHRQQTHDD